MIRVARMVRMVTRLVAMMVVRFVVRMGVRRKGSLALTHSAAWRS